MGHSALADTSNNPSWNLMYQLGILKFWLLNASSLLRSVCWCHCILILINIVVVNWFGILFIFGYFEFVKNLRCAEFTNDIELGLCSCLFLFKINSDLNSCYFLFLILFFILLNWEINFVNYMLTWMLNKFFLMAMSAFTVSTVYSICYVDNIR